MLYILIIVSFLLGFLYKERRLMSKIEQAAEEARVDVYLVGRDIIGQIKCLQYLDNDQLDRFLQNL